MLSYEIRWVIRKLLKTHSRDEKDGAEPRTPGSTICDSDEANDHLHSPAGGDTVRYFPEAPDPRVVAASSANVTITSPHQHNRNKRKDSEKGREGVREREEQCAA